MKPKTINKKEEKKTIPEGVNQKFKTATGKMVTLMQVISRDDVWETKGRVVRTIVTHDGVKKIADKAGINKVVQYEFKISPTVMNDMLVSIEATVCRGKECVNEIGEASNSNLGSKGRNNRVNMAEKRAYDRAVFRLLGITGLLSEEELKDEEISEYNPMTIIFEGLDEIEKKHIAPKINQLILAKEEKDLIVFFNKMKEEKTNYSEKELEKIKRFYVKRANEMKQVKTNF